MTRMSAPVFLLRAALVCGLLALLSLPVHPALPAFFVQGMVFCVIGAALLALAELPRAMARAWRALRF
ncbi:MAG: hypothetical protein JSR53_09395 [Proteobacteria bacterium]|nr:hypothetical protein [Pseudomonadota bacterium]